MNHYQVTHRQDTPTVLYHILAHFILLFYMCVQKYEQALVLQCLVRATVCQNSYRQLSCYRYTMQFLLVSLKSYVQKKWTLTLHLQTISIVKLKHLV